MIFVTVGFHSQPFDRLITKMDQIAGKIDEQVIIQIGISKYQPKNAKFFNYIEKDKDFLQYLKAARLVITHGGAGTILDLLKIKKPIIIVPRLRDYREHSDNQQLELATQLHKTGRASCVLDVNRLEQMIFDNDKFQDNFNERNSSLENFLKNYLEGLNAIL